MLVSFLFTVWIVAAVSSSEVKESNETSMEDHDSSNDEKSSNESNEVKDRSDDKDSSSTEKDDSAEDESSAEKDSSSSEQNSSEEKENKDSNESSEEGHSYVRKKEDKYTKTTQKIIKPGSNLPNLPPCAVCNFQAGGVFIPWSIPCTGCSYRAPSCSPMGFCCLMNPECAKRPQGKPCPKNSYLGLPMQSINSLVGNNQLNVPLVHSTTYASPMIPQIPGTIPQMSPGMSPLGIPTSQIFIGPNGKYVNTLPGISQAGTPAVYGSLTANGLIPNNRLNNPVYQALGLQTGGNALGGGPIINPTCPSAKVACATLGGICIPSTAHCGGVHKQDEQLCGSNCKCCIKPKNKECSDHDKNCLAWANAGYCNTYPKIKANCKVSCEICKPNLGEGSPLVSSIDFPIAPSSYISNKCKDKMPNCKSLATSTACANYPKMKELCPMTCRVPCTILESPVQHEGNVCSLLTKNTCTDVLAGHCIPLDEACGGFFKEDPTLCGDGNCKCCITERCNVSPEDSAICSHFGGKCIPDPKKCRGTSYPLCGSDTCQCCIEKPGAIGSCPVNQQCGNEGICNLGGCQEGYEVSEGQCPGLECYCCKKVNGTPMLRIMPTNSTHGTCSDKKCGDGGTCRDITCLPGEVRLSENCGDGSCVCCKKATYFDHPEESCKAAPCGDGGKCRCTSCKENEERIKGYCEKTDCICCKTMTNNTGTKSYIIPSSNSDQHPGPVDVLRSKIRSHGATKSYTRPRSDHYPVDLRNSQLQSNEDSRYPETRQLTRAYQPPNDGNRYSTFPNSLRNEMPYPECRPPKNNRCQKKGGNCLPLNHSCKGKSIGKFCGKSKNCQCCLPIASFQALPSYGKSVSDERFFSSPDLRDQLVDPIKDENIGPVNPPPIGFTDDKIESIHNIHKDTIELTEEDDQSKAEVNIESTSDSNNQNQGLDNEQTMVVDGAQSSIDDMKFLEAIADSPIENQHLAIIDDVSEIPTAASLVSDITTETSFDLNNKDEESVLNIPSHTISSPMDLEPLVETPVSKDSMESNYEMNILPELDMIDYYDSINIPLDETESGLYSDQYYEISNINPLIDNDKSIIDDNDSLIDNTATDLNTLDRFSNNLDNLNDKLSTNLYSSLDVKKHFNEANNVDSTHANSFMDLEDYNENYDNMYIMDDYDQIDKGRIVHTIDDNEHIEDSNTPVTDYYDQVEDTQSMDTEAYQSNYGNMYTSTDDGYYMADYSNINQYGAQY